MAKTGEPGSLTADDRQTGSQHSVDAVRPLDIARLAHELRTPLGAISVLAEIIRDERLGPVGVARYRAYAADIYDSAVQANAVLGAFLDPSGAGCGSSGPLEFVELDLGELTAGSVSALTVLAERFGVALSAQIPASLPHIIADRRSVRQILDNLIANALKFTPPGGAVTVSLRYVAGGPVMLEVADTGDGMTAVELERARGGGTGAEALRRRSGGSGIGIPLVGTLAAGGGATLVFESELGSGTKAIVAFPHGRVVPV